MRYRSPAVLAAVVLPLLIPDLSVAISETLDMNRAKRGNVAFTHRKHAYTYQISCDRCHHNIDPIQVGETSCKGCHMNKKHSGLCHQCHLSSRERDYEERKAALEEELQHSDLPTLFKAFHNLCRNCHAEANEREQMSAPYECGGCHR